MLVGNPNAGLSLYRVFLYYIFLDPQIRGKQMVFTFCSGLSPLNELALRSSTHLCIDMENHGKCGYSRCQRVLQ